MAPIKGRSPKPGQPDGRQKLIFKLAEGQNAGIPADAQRLIKSFLEKAKPTPLLDDYEQLSEGAQRVLANYMSIDLPPGVKPENVEEVAKRLAMLPAIEAAYVGGGPCPPPVNASDDPRSANQGYLNAAPGGIDARWAWNSTDGASVGFVDLERGWVLNHEDLAAASIGVISGVSQDYHGHGTAVLGEVVASDNNIGVVGIAPRSSARVVSQWRTSSSYNTAAAILSAADSMAAGDVLLLEAQTSVDSAGYLPVEVETAVFDAIRYAVNRGVVVVEAGANGSRNLDNFRDSAGKAVLNRNSNDFKDSGAIMVGAASSGAPHTRLGFSNFGSRVDCFAWGENIETTGDGGTGTTTNGYTGFFNGTSGASPIVTGAALLIQSWFRAAGKDLATSQSMRSILGSSATGTQSVNPVADQIGVMPNLRAIIEHLKLISTIPRDQYVSLVLILIGIIDDSPGYIWVPGKGPVPVDPGWGSKNVRISPAQKDLLSSLAISEIARAIGNKETRSALVSQSVKSLKLSADRLEQELLG